MCWFSIAKYLLWAFNFFLWLGGLAVLGIGIYLVVGDGSQFVELGDINFYSASGSIFIVAGSCAFVLGFIGCKGSKNESTGMLGLYFISLLVLLVLQVGLGIWALCNFDSINDAVSSGIEDQSLDESSTSYINMEQTIHCCGKSKGCQDWADANQSKPFGCECEKGESKCQPIKSLPCSASFTLDSDTYDYIYNQIVGMIIACCMYQAIKEHKGYA